MSNEIEQHYANNNLEANDEFSIIRKSNKNKHLDKSTQYLTNLVMKGRFRDTLESIRLLRQESSYDYFYTLEKFINNINNVNSNSLQLTDGTVDH